MKPHPLTLGDKVTVNLVRGAAKVLMPFRIIPASRKFPSEEFSYGEKPLEQLQYFVSDKAKTPIVFIHGGGWAIGSMRSVAIGHGHFIRQGFPIFNLDYPMAPENPFPLPLISCLKALIWIKKHYPQAEQVHLMGDSAGGNLATMAGLLISNPKQLAMYLPDHTVADFPRVQSIVSLYGVLDRLSWVEKKFPTAKTMMRCYGGAASLEATVDDNLALCPLDTQWERRPSMYIATAERDRLKKSSYLARDYFAETSEPLEFKCYPNVGHGFYEANRKAESRHLKRDITAFFNAVS